MQSVALSNLYNVFHLKLGIRSYHTEGRSAASKGI
jgi:hypothetical protein